MPTTTVITKLFSPALSHFRLIRFPTSFVSLNVLLFHPVSVADGFQPSLFSQAAVACCNSSLPIVAVRRLEFQSHIQEVLGSNIGSQIGYPD
jgi:hypothetical protein